MHQKNNIYAPEYYITCTIEINNMHIVKIYLASTSESDQAENTNGWGLLRIANQKNIERVW